MSKSTQVDISKPNLTAQYLQQIQLPGNFLVDTSQLFQNDENKGMDERQVQEHEEATKIKTIQNLALGPSHHVFPTWYFSPVPGQFQNLDTLWVCENCLGLFVEEWSLIQHLRNKDWAEGAVIKCQQNHSKGIILPPGNEIYRDQKVSVFEVLGGSAGIFDKKATEAMGGSKEQMLITEIAHGPIGGLHERIYCENLCYIAKLFLDHKNIRFDCTPFLFYILVERNSISGRQTIAGYFSKEFGPQVENNLSCILVLPHCQRKGFGKFLIEFSYELSKIEKKKGTPERPLSDLGYRSYVTYWAIQIFDFLLKYDTQSRIDTKLPKKQQFSKRTTKQIGKLTTINNNCDPNKTKLSVEMISEATFIDSQDVIYILENFGILRKLSGNQTQIFMYINRDYLETLLLNLGVKRCSDDPHQFIINRMLEPTKIKWAPLVFEDGCQKY